MTPRATGHRETPLTRDRAVQMAVALADATGIHSVSMRKLARALGVKAMSLYHHVKNKDDLIDGMVDVVFGEIAPPAPDAACRTAMRERVESARAVLVRHPWAITLMEGRTTPGHATLKHHDAVVRCLREAGFSMPMVGHTMSLVDCYVRGFSMREASSPARGHDAANHSADEFAFGLQLILDGIERAQSSDAGRPTA